MSAPGPGELEPTQADGQAGAARERAAAREAVTWVREESTRLIENYKAQTRYYKWRSWIIGGYLLVALVSIFIALPPFNTVKAYARITRDDLDGRPLIYVRNDSTEEWNHVRVLINDQWLFEREHLLPGDAITANIATFRKQNGGGPGLKPPGDLVPHTLRVRCDQGSFYESMN
jgi:hypothetical protein